MRLNIYHTNDIHAILPFWAGSAPILRNTGQNRTSIWTAGTFWT